MSKVKFYLRHALFWSIACVMAIGVVCTSFVQAAIINAPGLTHVRIWETTGVTTSYDFVQNGPQMVTQIGVGTLGPGTFDIWSLPNEQYDIFYSDALGNFNVNGDHVTVEAVYTNPVGGGGLNLAAVDLMFGATPVRADILTSFVGLGPNYVPGSELFAVDADTPVPTTTTQMGSTIVPPIQHLRVTVTWSGIPEPSTVMLGMFGLVLCAASSASRRR